MLLERRKNIGVTLIELMIALAIIAIIAAVGYPMYSAQAEKTRRTEGKEALSNTALKQQQFFQQRRRYTSNVMELYDGIGATMETRSGYYTISAELTGGGTGFTLTATPIADSPQEGDYTLTLNHLGQKTPAQAW